MADAPFRGMRATTDILEFRRPLDYRQQIFKEMPAGDLPLTALMSVQKPEKTTSSTFHWSCMRLPTQSVSITEGDLYTSVALTNKYAGGGKKGQVLYVKMGEVDSGNFRVGHTALLRDDSIPRCYARVEVVDVVANGSNSYVAAKLLEDDDNGTVDTADLRTCDTISVTGNVSPEGSERPQALDYDPTDYWNYCQHFQTAIEMTGSAAAEVLRTYPSDPGNLRRCRTEALQRHGFEMEYAWLWGHRDIGVGSNGKPKPFTGGIAWFVETYAPGNIVDYARDPEFSSKTWDSGGKDFLEREFAAYFAYARRDSVLAPCGSAAASAVNRLAYFHGDVRLDVGATGFGLKVNRWETVHGEVNFKRHPLFQRTSAERHMLILLDPENIVYRYKRDTMHLPDTGLIDGIQEAWLTEAGLELHFPNQFRILLNVGVDGVNS